MILFSAFLDSFIHPLRLSRGPSTSLKCSIRQFDIRIRLSHLAVFFSLTGPGINRFIFLLWIQHLPLQTDGQLRFPLNADISIVIFPSDLPSAASFHSDCSLFSFQCEPPSASLFASIPTLGSNNMRPTLSSIPIFDLSSTFIDVYPIHHWWIFTDGRD